MNHMSTPITVHDTTPRWKEAPMYGHDLFARERQTSLEREARDHWYQHMLVAEAAKAGGQHPAPSLVRRARVRLGEALIFTGQAISGATDDGAKPTSMERPA